ncbi:MAG: UDP-N-acetylmuramoyl-L-alanyl-D-glutamate--2,6-diaminopimelate ligase, partial [Deltaproteobacteria bacterium]|nr:UDP-N-acetylmuramoyl-L-alanyl-D-glutamate--2,6-diaminopimelate ligase [Deltaproteobacteria bacterium]
MRLGQLIEGIPIRELEGDREIEVKGLSYDSRRIQPGYLFVAIKGHTQDGHEFIHDATR